MKFETNHINLHLLLLFIAVRADPKVCIPNNGSSIEFEYEMIYLYMMTVEYMASREFDFSKTNTHFQMINSIGLKL